MPGQTAQNSSFTTDDGHFFKESVTKLGGRIKKAHGKKKILGQSSEPSSSVRGGEFAAKSLSPGVIIVGKRRCRSPGV